MQRKKARTESMNDGNRVAHDCAQDTLRFKVLSLNCWGLPDVITNRQQRGKQSRVRPQCLRLFVNRSTASPYEEHESDPWIVDAVFRPSVTTNSQRAVYSNIQASK